MRKRLALSGDELQLHLESPLREVQQYWNEHIHDLEISSHPPGSPQFFQDLDEYRFDKLGYLLNIIDFGSYQDKKLLELGCGIGTDLVRFASGGAIATGVDLSTTALRLGAMNANTHGVNLTLHLADGESLPFDDESFDVVYGHGVLQYTNNPAKMVSEAKRVLKRNGKGIFMVYNRISWLNVLSMLTNVPLEHEDAPILRKYSIGEFRTLLAPFELVRIVPERFPVRSRLHGGWKGFFFNQFFVNLFHIFPRFIVRRFGWHLMGFCEKHS